jgi:hypothetical protein
MDFFLSHAEARSFLRIKPVHKKQQENFDRVLKCITHLLYLLLATAKTDEHKTMVSGAVMVTSFNREGRNLRKKIRFFVAFFNYFRLFGK